MAIAWQVIESAAGPALICDWIVNPHGDREKLRINGPPNEPQDETIARGFNCIALRLRQVADMYEERARYLTDREYRRQCQERAYAFAADGIERDIRDGWRCEVTGEDGFEGEEDSDG